MSRCFPFPPPGYEKKTRTDEVDLLKKEKKREKKHKKDKKDKEKKESKEKREKEGRDGKHKEKDKKEKHRDKKKDKDKSRDRDKNKISTADDKGLSGQAEDNNVEKEIKQSGSKGILFENKLIKQYPDVKGLSGQAEDHNIQKEIKQSGNKGILFENKLIKQYPGNNGENARENNHVAEANKDSKFLVELDRRLKVNDGGAGNQLVQKVTGTDHTKDEGTVRLVAKGSGAWLDGNDKEKLKDKSLDVKKIDGKGIQGEVRPIGNPTAQNHAGNFDPRIDGVPKLLGKYLDRNLEATMEGKEKVKEKKDEGREKVKEKKDEGKEKVEEKKNEGEEKIKQKKDDKRGVKRKDKEKEKKGHGKDKDRDKEKKKEEKGKEHTELKATEQNKFKESNNTGPLGLNSFTRISTNNHENAVGGVSLEIAGSGVNHKKRKNSESNGVPHVNDSFPNKLLKPSSSFQNGMILGPGQISIPDASHGPEVATSSVKVEKKECKVNGTIEARPFRIPSNKPHAATMPTDDLITEATAKPPHPDAKYLSQVYTVPKVELSDLDDHDWLLGSGLSQERKSVVKSPAEVRQTPQVWAEALHIEQADVYALPYVIPY